MKKALFFALIAILVVPQLLAESAAGRAESAATVLTEIMATPDKGIPEEILGSAKCVAVVPSLLKGGFVVGGAMVKAWPPAALPTAGARLLPSP